MLVIADGFRRPILLFLLWYHFLIFGKLTGIDLVQIWIALVPKGTGSVPQSMGKRNWSRSKRNWEIPISDQIGSGDGWSSTCTVENGWRWSRTAFPILNNQHTPVTYREIIKIIIRNKIEFSSLLALHLIHLMLNICLLRICINNIYGKS